MLYLLTLYLLFGIVAAIFILAPSICKWLLGVKNIEYLLISLVIFCFIGIIIDMGLSSGLTAIGLFLLQIAVIVVLFMTIPAFRKQCSNNITDMGL